MSECGINERRKEQTNQGEDHKEEKRRERKGRVKPIPTTKEVSV